MPHAHPTVIYLPWTPDISIPLAALGPFLAALVAPWVRRAAGPAAGWLLALVPLAIFLSLLPLLEPVAAGEAVSVSVPWIPALGVAFSFLLDGLSLTFALLISGIGTFIILYSGGYLKTHPQQGRFFAFMLMFMGSMLGLVLADDLITLFVFWELTSVTSFLLIGFDHTRQAARRAAIQALVITSGGGLLLLVGLVTLMAVTGQTSMSGLLEGQGSVQAHGAYMLVLLLVVAGAFAKSAQVPLHFWLPNAMEAPTPVSAFLHSATMVKAGVYLLARMNPVLGGTGAWFWILVLFGGATLLAGGLLALRQTDLKQMLAYTTMGSLGLLVLLIGVGTEAALFGMTAYLVAHALFKAGLFMVAGAIDHGTGTRDITILGGLREHMPVTFIAALVAAFSMAGLPIAMGFLAKEEMYLALTAGLWPDLAILAVLIAGNALMMAVGLSIAIRPFAGDLRPTPHDPHEGGVTLLAGPVVLGVLGLVAGLFTAWLNTYVLTPTGAAVSGRPVAAHLALGFDLANPALWASALTWTIGGILYWKAEAIRFRLRRIGDAIGWTFDAGFDSAIYGLTTLSHRVLETVQHGRMDLYVLTFFALVAAALYLPLLAMGGLPSLPPVPDMPFYLWGALLVTAAGLLAVVLFRIRLNAVIALGIQGFGTAMIFMLLGAPDLSFTQFMVETLSVVILALVMTRLDLDASDSRDLEHTVRDAAIALLVGLGILLLMLAVLENPLNTRLSDFFNATSTAVAHGHNVVNVILVDYRAIDTLGEISVVMAAGLAILALIRIRPKKPVVPVTSRPSRRRKSA